MELMVVSHSRHLEQAHAIREEGYRERFPHGDPWWLDADRDTAGVVFLLVSEARPVATMRIIGPQARHAWEMTGLGLPLPEVVQSPDQADSTWELGRLAVVRDGRAHLLRRLFLEAVQWAVAHVQLTGIVSYCHARRTGAFRAIGCDVVAGPLSIPRRGEDYYTIHGSVTTLACHLASTRARAQPAQVHQPSTRSSSANPTR